MTFSLKSILYRLINIIYLFRKNIPCIVLQLNCFYYILIEISQESRSRDQNFNYDFTVDSPPKNRVLYIYANVCCELTKLKSTQ
ncbi:hypothetical protein P618_200654 [Holospora obtusa F1]|uniref:Uncharacterized protein n=1 Tax=Holospora obtusa F1 TaxID=1399147 RepID=W6TTQ5_HOLOB|nr:hypothetical protein P618_200654 [Holospora obtusa F1]